MRGTEEDQSSKEELEIVIQGKEDFQQRESLDKFTEEKETEDKDDKEIKKRLRSQKTAREDKN